MTWMRVLLFAGLAIGAWQVAAIMIGSVPGVVMNWSLYLPILTTAGIAAIGPLAFAAILKAWTSVVPQSRWNAWYVARHTARFGLSASTSVETPIMVGFGLVAGTATLAGMAAVAVSNAVTACAVGMPLFDGLAFGEGLAVSLAGFVLVLAATLVPTLAALRKEPATVLAMGE